MPSAPLLDFESLLKPILGEDPAGVSTPFTLRQELEEARKEENPEDYDENDPRRPEQAKRADWPQIVRKTEDALANTSKDLMLAARLTEALTRINGFAGLRDGLHLMNRMLTDCWDRVHPSIEDGDLEVRATPFNWLDDPDRGARFPMTLRMLPILVGPDGEYSLLVFRQMQDGKGNVKKEDVDKAIQYTSREACQELADDAAAALKELDAVRTVLDEKLGQYAPGFTSLRPAILDCQNLINLILQRKGPAPSEEAPAEEGDASQDGATGDGATGQPRTSRATREGLYQQLNAIASQLQQMEPHSPIPYLIQKAIELGAMPFPQLMKALLRDDNVLSELNRELGIREEQPQE